MGNPDRIIKSIVIVAIAHQQCYLNELVDLEKIEQPTELQRARIEWLKTSIVFTNDFLHPVYDKLYEYYPESVEIFKMFERDEELFNKSFRTGPCDCLVCKDKRKLDDNKS